MGEEIFTMYKYYFNGNGYLGHISDKLVDPEKELSELGLTDKVIGDIKRVAAGFNGVLICSRQGSDKAYEFTIFTEDDDTISIMNSFIANGTLLFDKVLREFADTHDKMGKSYGFTSLAIFTQSMLIPAATQMVENTSKKDFPYDYTNNRFVLGLAKALLNSESKGDDNGTDQDVKPVVTAMGNTIINRIFALGDKYNNCEHEREYEHVFLQAMQYMGDLATSIRADVDNTYSGKRRSTVVDDTCKCIITLVDMLHMYGMTPTDILEFMSLNIKDWEDDLNPQFKIVQCFGDPGNLDYVKLIMPTCKDVEVRISRVADDLYILLYYLNGKLGKTHSTSTSEDLKQTLYGFIPSGDIQRLTSEMADKLVEEIINNLK